MVIGSRRRGRSGADGSGDGDGHRGGRGGRDDDGEERIIIDETPTTLESGRAHPTDNSNPGGNSQDSGLVWTPERAGYLDGGNAPLDYVTRRTPLAPAYEPCFGDAASFAEYENTF